MKLKNRNLYKKAFRAEFFLIAQKKLSDINRVEEFKENIMLDHRTETFMAVCSVMNYREAAELLHITQPAVTQHIQFLEKEYGCRLFLYENRKLIRPLLHRCWRITCVPFSSVKIFSGKR